MCKYLSIVFCIISCLALAVCIPIGAIFEFIYCLIPLSIAVISGILMYLFKNKPWQKKQITPKIDFMNSPKENEAIRNSNNQKDN